MARAERMPELLRRATAIQSSARGRGMCHRHQRAIAMRTPQATSTQLETSEVSVGNSARTEEIRRRAYEVYLERGKRSGHDVDDWVRAEQGLERRVLGRA